jgi:hypothetical protein
MNTQDSQGNGLIGGGIGLGLGGAGAYFGRNAVEGFALNRFSNADKYAKEFDAYENAYVDSRQDVASAAAKAKREGISFSDKQHPRYTEMEAARARRNAIYDKMKNAAQRAIPYANAAKLLYMAGLPITASLLGSTLTD